MKLTTQELIKIAKKDRELIKKSATATDTNDVHKFIAAVNIKDGKHAVRTIIIYKAYRMWAAKPLSFRSFFCSFGNFFHHQRKGKNFTYYLLNYRPIELLNRVDNMLIKI